MTRVQGLDETNRCLAVAGGRSSSCNKFTADFAHSLDFLVQTWPCSEYELRTPSSWVVMTRFDLRISESYWRSRVVTPLVINLRGQKLGCVQLSSTKLFKCIPYISKWVQNYFRNCFSVLGIFWGPFVMPVFHTICSILELEAAISTVFATFWSWNFSL